MNKDCRILFYKTGIAKYISHLDLMRTMQRCFIRAGVSIKHTEGFNPHPYMAFALPLSVGCESVCELMDFRLHDDDAVKLDELPGRLNPAMPEGASGDMTFEEYVSLPSSKIRFHVITRRQCNSEAEQEELEKKLEEAFVEQGICSVNGRVYFDNGEGHFDELQNGEINTVQYIISEYASCHIQFEMEDTTGFSSVVWKEN